MKQYLTLLKEVHNHGVKKSDRTGIGTKSLFGAQIRCRLSEGFPLLTTKKIHLPSVVHELLWFLKGDTNISYLKDNKVRIWDEWADENGDLGPVYGKQWRHWEGTDGTVHDQIQNAIDLIKSQPDSRRIIVSAWNVGDLDKMALMPCHALFQFYVAGNKLSLQLYQRSADLFLGVPFNIASYSLLLHMIAQQCDLEVGDFVWTGGDVHIYDNHQAQVETQLVRQPYPLCNLKLRKAKDIFSYVYEDFEFENYQYHPLIKAVVAV